MNSWNRSWAVLGSLLLAMPQLSSAQSGCAQQIDEIQRHLQAFDRGARQMGPGFLRDDSLAVSLDAFRKRLDGVSAADRLPPAWRGLREADAAKTKLQSWNEQLKRWAEGIAGYRNCLRNTVCSIGDLIKQQEISNRELAAWLKSFGDLGLEKASERLEKASDIMKTFTSGAGSETTGAMAAALTCLADNRPRSLLASPPEPVAPTTLNIEHQPVGCAVAERFPRLEARFTPAETIARAQVLFQGENAQEWYAVEMKSEGAGFSGVLPKPKKSLKAFRYYIEVTDKALGTNRTADYTTSVVTSASECKGKVMAGTVVAASVLLLGPAGAAAVPVGFASIGVVAAGSGAAAGAAGAAGGGGGGLSTGALVGIVGGVGVAAVVAVAAKGGGSNAMPGAGGSTTATPAPTPAPTTVPTPTPTPTPAVAQYDGNYRGGISGSFGGTPVTGPVAYSVNNGQITLSEPGAGSGTVDASGSTSFAGKAMLNVGIVLDCTFKGTFQVGSAGGTWSCSGSGSSGSGNWNASRQ